MIADVLTICLAGGVGAALRFVLDGVIRQHTTTAYPLPTSVINVTGSLVLGLLTGLALGQLIPMTGCWWPAPACWVATRPSARPAWRRCGYWRNGAGSPPW